MKTKKIGILEIIFLSSILVNCNNTSLESNLAVDSEINNDTSLDSNPAVQSEIKDETKIEISIDSLKAELIGKLFSGKTKELITKQLGELRSRPLQSTIDYLVTYSEKTDLKIILDNKLYIITNICRGENSNCPNRDESFLNKKKIENFNDSKEQKAINKLKNNLLEKTYEYPFSIEIINKYGNPETLLGTDQEQWFVYFPKGNFSLVIDKSDNKIKEFFYGKL